MRGNALGPTAGGAQLRNRYRPRPRAGKSSGSHGPAKRGKNPFAKPASWRKVGPTIIGLKLPVRGLLRPVGVNPGNRQPLGRCPTRHGDSPWQGPGKVCVLSACWPRLPADVPGWAGPTGSTRARRRTSKSAQSDSIHILTRTSPQRWWGAGPGSSKNPLRNRSEPAEHCRYSAGRRAAIAEGVPR